MELITEKELSESNNKKRASFQDGYLPVPLSCVPPESLNGLKIYLATPPTFSLYKNTDLYFGRKDYDRLVETEVEYVYIGTHDHQAYYNAIEKSLDSILQNRKIVQERKSEILYSTTLALAHQLLSTPPGAREIKQTQQLTRSTIHFVINNPQAFNHLFSVSNHDFYTATHMTNVSTIMIAFANHIGIESQAMLHELGTGAMLHDIGKMFIPQDLLNCKEQLTSKQIAVIQSHVQKGIDHLSTISDVTDNIMRMVAEHHEKCDGTGYPNKLKSKHISIFGKLASIVDCFEAMISVRPYRNHSLSSEEALEIIQSMTPDSFDETIVNSFAHFVETTMHGQKPDPAHLR